MPVTIDYSKLRILPTTLSYLSLLRTRSARGDRQPDGPPHG